MSSQTRPRVSLRPYQTEIAAKVLDAKVDGHNRVVVVSPTGSGKGTLISFYAERLAAAGKRILLLAPTREVRNQLSDSLTAAGVVHGRIVPGEPELKLPVQVATIATLAQPKRRARWRGWADYVLADEVHHATAKSWRAVLLDQAAARWLGFTATPWRSDGAGLGGLFTAMVLGPTVAELVAWGFLSPFVVYAPSSPDLDGVRVRGGDYALDDLRERMGGVVISAAPREWLRLCPGVATIVFCVDREHGRAVEAAFIAAGVKALFIDGNTPDVERRAALDALASGELPVLVNCGLISEGIDVPAVGCVMLLRPTQSLALHLQQIGRGLRIAPGKMRTVILDMAGNVARLGFPDEAHEWTLEGSVKRSRDETTAPRARHCPACTSMNRPAARACVECGADLRTPKERREAEVALAEAQRLADEDFVRTAPMRDAISWAGADHRRLLFVARARGYRPGWAWHRFNEMQQAESRR